MLAKMVKNGKLPNVNNRLPLDPLVVTPHERIGKYGGTWRQGMKTIADWGLVNRQATHHDAQTFINDTLPLSSCIPIFRSGL